MLAHRGIPGCLADQTHHLGFDGPIDVGVERDRRVRLPAPAPAHRLTAVVLFAQNAALAGGDSDDVLDWAATAPSLPSGRRSLDRDRWRATLPTPGGTDSAITYLRMLSIWVLAG